MFEDWLQDAQLPVNECFENPETREDMEASLQRLQVSKPVMIAFELKLLSDLQ